jgi:hypothetical protein
VLASRHFATIARRGKNGFVRESIVSPERRIVSRAPGRRNNPAKSLVRNYATPGTIERVPKRRAHAVMGCGEKRDFSHRPARM